jgi:electron transfer flavoprotein beta subunit
MAEKQRISARLKNVVVAVKQVPDTTQVKVDPETGTLIREGIPFIINPLDIHAVETALQLKDKYGSKIIAITMGPPNAKETLRRCLASGVDDFILISDRAFVGADTLATSLVLSETFRRISETFGPVDMVICGKQTIDGDTAQVGPGMARLGLLVDLVDQGCDLDPRLTVTCAEAEGRKESLWPASALLRGPRNQHPRYPVATGAWPNWRRSYLTNEAPPADRLT